MIKTACIVLFMAAVASAGLLHAAPLVAAPAAVAALPAPIVTARSSQVVARNYNTFAAAPLAAYAAAVPAAVPAALPAAAPAPIALAAPAAPAAPLPYAAFTYAAYSCTLQSTRSTFETSTTKNVRREILGSARRFDRRVFRRFIASSGASSGGRSTDSSGVDDRYLRLQLQRARDQSRGRCTVRRQPCDRPRRCSPRLFQPSSCSARLFRRSCRHSHRRQTLKIVTKKPAAVANSRTVQQKHPVTSRRNGHPQQLKQPTNLRHRAGVPLPR